MPQDKHSDEFRGTERFEVLRSLGKGAMGQVYQVFDREKGAIVALKTLIDNEGSSLYRFKAEFRNLADINHPNLVGLHELWGEDDRWFFTMDLVDGMDFLSYVRGDAEVVERTVPTALSADELVDNPTAHLFVPLSPPPDIERLRDALRQLAEGVAALHEAGKLHRDIKPSNVLVTYRGQVVVLDFGLVLDVQQGDSTPHLFAGTAVYASPEQAARQPLTPASDWYSVGVMLYQTLTGGLPFDGPPLRVLMAKQKLDPIPPIELLPDLPQDLSDLAMQLLARRPSERPDWEQLLRRLGASPPSGGHRISTFSSDHPLIGRGEQLAALDDALSEMRTGTTVVVFVTGSSGMGKSAMVERYTDKLRRGSDVLVLSGRCYERESVPYKALDSLIDSLSHHLSRLPHQELEGLVPIDGATIARLFPVLRRVYAISESPRRPEASDPHEMRRRATFALRGLLAKLAERTPLVLTIDDFHWGDADSVGLLGDLLRGPEPPPLMLLVCHRGEEPGGVPDELRQSLEGSAIAICDVALDALSDADARELAAALLGDKGASRAHVEAIAREAQGNPFFVAELVRYLQSGLTEPGQLDRFSLKDAIRARIAQLSMTERALLELIAVAGGPVAPAVLAQAACLAPEDHGALGALRAGHLVRAASRDALEPYHDRIRVAVLGGLDADTLRAHHAALARTMDMSGQDDPEALALHYRGAGEFARAYEFAERAGDKAAAALAFDRAAEMYQVAMACARLAGASRDEAVPELVHDSGYTAVDVPARADRDLDVSEDEPDELDEPSEPSEPAAESSAELSVVAPPGKSREDDAIPWQLRRKLGDALANAGRGTAAAREYLRAARQGNAGRPGNAADILELKRRAAEQLLRAGHVDRGIAALRAVLGVVGMRLAESPRRAMASLLMRRAQLRLRGLGFKERDSSQVSAEALTRIDICWSATTSLGTIDTIRGADFQTRHLLLALAAGEPYRVARALALEAMYTGTQGPSSWRRTQALLAQARGLADSQSDPHALGLVVLAGAMAHYQSGHYRPAFEQFEEAAEIFTSQCAGATFEVAEARRFGVDSLFNLGEIRELCRRVPALLRDAEQRGDRHGATDMRTGLPNAAWLAAGDPERAHREAEIGMKHWPKHHGFHLQHYYHALARANAALYEGDTAAARRWATEMWPDLRRTMQLRIQAVRVEAWFLRARTALAHAAASGAGDALADALRVAGRLESERVPAASPSAALVRAGAALLDGDARAARRHAARAIEGFEAADMALMRALARRLRGAVDAASDGAERREAGAAEVVEVDAWMRGQSIAEPGRFARLFTLER